MFEPITTIYKHDGLKVMLVTNGHTLDQVLEAFDNAVKGSGYYPKGELDYREEE